MVGFTKKSRQRIKMLFILSCLFFSFQRVYLTQVKPEIITPNNTESSYKFIGY
jgi:hypothetical protein